MEHFSKQILRRVFVFLITFSKSFMIDYWIKKVKLVSVGLLRYKSFLHDRG